MAPNNNELRHLQRKLLIAFIAGAICSNLITAVGLYWTVLTPEIALVEILCSLLIVQFFLRNIRPSGAILALTVGWLSAILYPAYIILR